MGLAVKWWAARAELYSRWRDDAAARFFRQDFQPRIHVTSSDFASITDNGALCDENGQLGPVEFENVIRRQIVEMLQAKLILTGSARSQVAADIVHAHWQAIESMSVGIFIYRSESIKSKRLSIFINNFEIAGEGHIYT